MVQSVSYTPMRGGLNNQKLALLGLVRMAKAQGLAVSIPNLSDYKGETMSASLVAFDDVYDVGAFVEYLDSVGVPATRSAPDTVVKSWDCFSHAMQNVAIGGDAQLLDDVTRFFLSLRLTPRLSSIVDDITTRLAAIDPQIVGCQLRIEKDWQAHVRTLNDRAKAGQIQAEEFGIGAFEILKKIRNTPKFTGARFIYAALDQYQLTQDLPHVKQEAESVGFDLLCKTDFDRVDLDRLSRLDASCIDFEICLACGSFVGNTRSTFANMIALTHYAQSRDAKSYRDYIYNSSEEGVTLRTDHGFKHTVAGATHAS